MSKTSQRRLSAAQKRLKERGPTPSEVTEMLALIGPSLMTDDPEMFWYFVGRAEHAGTRHADFEALAELVDSYADAMRELALGLRDPVTGFTPDDVHLETVGMLVLDDLAGVDMPILQSLSPWRCPVSGSDPPEAFRALIRGLPQESRRDLGLWFFADNAGVGADLHCLAVTLSGATLFQTLVGERWVRARAPRRAAALAVQMARDASEELSTDLAAADRVVAHVESLLGRELERQELDATCDVVRDALDHGRGPLARVALEAAFAALLEPETVEEQEQPRTADTAPATRSDAAPAALATPAASAPRNAAAAAAEREVERVQHLLAGALARERDLANTLQRLRSEGQQPQGDVRARVTELLGP
jgi:hypothetical protein